MRYAVVATLTFVVFCFAGLWGVITSERATQRLKTEGITLPKRSQPWTALRGIDNKAYRQCQVAVIVFYVSAAVFMATLISAVWM